MKRRDFAIAGTTITAAAFLGCSGDGEEPGGTGGSGTGGTSTGGAGTGGSGTGGVGTGGASGGSGSGGASGGSGSGGASGGSGSGGASGGSGSGGASGGSGTGGASGGSGTGGASGGSGTGGASGSGGSDMGTGGSQGPACSSVTHENDKHMHTLEIPAADVDAGAEKTYTAGGMHMHMVTVTAEHFMTLKTSGTVEVYQAADSTNHDHTYILTCVQ